jgi:hypothetical protein
VLFRGSGLLSERMHYSLLPHASKNRKLTQAFFARAK